MCCNNWWLCHRVTPLPGALLDGGVEVGTPRLLPALTQHRAPRVQFPAVAEVLAGALPWLPGHCFLHGQRKGSLWKEGSHYGRVGCMHWTWGEACGGFISCSSPLRLSRKYFSHIPGCPSGCFGVGENTCWSPYNLHGFHANIKAEFQELVKCGVFSKRLM